jgi:hypothetical protein
MEIKKIWRDDLVVSAADFILKNAPYESTRYPASVVAATVRWWLEDGEQSCYTTRNVAAHFIDQGMLADEARATAASIVNNAQFNRLLKN